MSGMVLLLPTALLALFLNGCWANLLPSFSLNMNNLALSEKTPVGELVYQLEGTDPEDTPVRFGIRGTDYFKVDATSGLVTLAKALDHEANDTLNFFVSIEDEVKGGINNVVEEPITVIVLDENDNAPIFDDTPYSTKIPEDSPIGTTVFPNIHVSDPDTVGQNIELECVDVEETASCDTFELTTLSSTSNEYKGVLILAKGLNYTERRNYQFQLKATDGELSSTSLVNIDVGDVQNTPPKFIGELSVEIEEDAPVFSLVITLHAEDGDKGDPRKIVYELINNPNNYFLLDAITGELRTAKPLDREAIDNSEGKVVVNIVAREIISDGVRGDTPLTATNAEVTVKIKDVNDEPPLFNKKEYFVSIPEDIPQGAALPGLDMTVKDTDSGNNSVFGLSLLDISDVFTVSPSIVNGSADVVVRVANSTLDYEDPNQRKFIVLVVARELDTPQNLSSTATITVTVTDANDNAPQFDYPNYSAVVSETASPETLVTSVVARDRDSGRFGEEGVVYKLSGTGADRFDINESTGTITVAECEYPGVKECLDFETKAEYLLFVEATDDDGKGQTTRVPLTITLTDSNDNPPRFKQPIYRVFVKEDAVRFEPDLFVDAVDLDKISRVTYSLIAGNDDGRFNIDQNTGKIRFASGKGFKPVKEGEGENYILLTVEANDGKFTSSAVVNITVVDVNNNSPKFEEENYVEAIKEDVPIGTFVLQLNATDADFGENAKISFTIQKGSFDDFSIDNSSGIISVSSKLDYDRRNTYVLEVIAEDNGDPKLTGTTTVTINIVNTNDKLPYFVPTTQKFEVMEDTPVGTVVYALVAMDPDVNTSEALNYAATEPITALDKFGREVLSKDDEFKQFFAVDKNTGKITVVNSLNRDLAAVIRMTVLVTDITATNVQQGEGLVIITITDVNDSPPQFTPPWTKENPIYKLALKEEQPIGTIVATYKAFDDDSDITGYKILPDSDYFEINHGTGIIQIKKQIDYETTKSLNFTVLAFDAGVPQLNASALVLVTIQNTNDNDPIFPADHYNASVAENSPNGTRILVVAATDADDGDYGRVTYTLVGQHAEHFRVDPVTGELTVANSGFLDHEKVNGTVVQVVATDGAPEGTRRSASVPVYLEILDVNDNAPVFAVKEFNLNVSENVRLNPPMPIFQVNASDADDGVFGSVHYSIVEGNHNDVFLLGVETGILYPHKSLMGQTRQYDLVIEARDGAGSGHLYDRATIHVQVLNVNEFKPIFVMPQLENATIEIPETTATENYQVMTVKAIDKDEGENGRITYHLKVNGKNIQETEEFVINEMTGELKSKVLLDREQKSKYQLILVARDHGTPKWYETIRYLTVLLVDMNDNRPEFPDTQSTNPYRFTVVENSEKDLLIGQVRALDRDEGKHAKVFYYLVSGNEDHSFLLDKLDGNLYTKKIFDRELKPEYDLLVLATNDPDFYLGEKKILVEEAARNKSFAQIKVTVEDLNDNPPKFEESRYYAAVNAMADINRVIANVTAVDPDAGKNGSLTYYIKAANLYKYGSDKSSGAIIPAPFNITQKGELATATYLAENNQHRFVVKVVAREDAYPEREAATNVHIWVFDPEQLIRIILSRPVQEVTQEKDEIIAELNNATQKLVIVDEIRYHTDSNGYKNEDWSDMYILVVDPLTNSIVPIPDVLKEIDSKYDFLKEYYAGFAIENVLPAFAVDKEEPFDAALAALVALVIVLFVGIIAFVAVCCYLRHWVISPSDLKKKDALIKKAIIDDLNMTENPLWIEQKLKIYEEQELTMQVFNEPEQTALARRESEEFMPGDNTYATIQHPNRRSNTQAAAMSLMDDLADYATLSGVPRNPGSAHSSLRGAPNYYEAAMGFQGSTFQVPEPLEGEVSHFEGFGASFRGSELQINREGQPEYVAELI